MTEIVGRLGVDISHWQDDSEPPKGVDFTKMKDAGAKFVIFKAGQAAWTDKRFDSFVYDSKGILPRGAYWYYDNGAHPQRQAESFRDALKGYDLELPLVVDYESTRDGNYKEWKYLSSMIIKLQEFFPNKPIMIYTGYYYWRDNAPPVGPQLEWFKDFPLWMAWYKRDYEDLLIPNPWDTVTIHQYTEVGSGPDFGVNTLGVDLNTYYGTDDEWNTFTSDFYSDEPVIDPPIIIDPPIVIDPPVLDEMTGTIVTLSGINIRNKPSVSGDKLGAMWYGSSVTGDEMIKDVEGNDWIKLSDVYIAANYSGETLVDLNADVVPDINNGVVETNLVVDAYSLNVRVSPRGTIVGNVKFGDIVTGLDVEGKIGVDGEWVEILEPAGFVAAWYVSVVETPIKPDVLYYGRVESLNNPVPILDRIENGTVISLQKDAVILLGDKLITVDGGDTWLHVISIDGTPSIGWVATNVDGKMYVQTAQIPKKTMKLSIPPAKPSSGIIRSISTDDGNEGKEHWHLQPREEPKQENWVGVDAGMSQPQTVVLFSDRDEHPGWVALSEEWQYFIIETLMRDNPGQSIGYYIAAYASLVADNRAFTDLNEKDEHTDYVLGLHIERDDPYLWKWSLTCKGNMVEAVRDGATLIINGLDITKTPPDVDDVYNDRSKIHYATQIYPLPALSNGMPKVVHFPQIKSLIGGRPEKTGTSIPLFKQPFHASISDIDAILMEEGKDYPVVNLERDL